MDIEVKVPATVANLGPGFDCLGVAVGTYLRVRFSEAEESVIVGKGRIRTLADNLTYKSFTAAFHEAGEEAPAIRLEILDIYPSARGLGASASAIVAGLVGARAAGDLSLEDDDLGRIAAAIEGHADNVLPALFGGLILSSANGWMKFDPIEAIQPLILIAGEKFKTTEARKVVPTEVPRSDAVANASAMAALIAVLTGREPAEALMWATEDRIHEPYRLPLMPESLELHRSLRAEGIATALSGAGPSLCCIVQASRLAEAEKIAREKLPLSWDVLTPGWDVIGAEVR